MSREGVTRIRVAYRIIWQANRYRREGSTRRYSFNLEFALPQGGVGGGGL